MKKIVLTALTCCIVLTTNGISYADPSGGDSLDQTVDPLVEAIAESWPRRYVCICAADKEELFPGITDYINPAYFFESTLNLTGKTCLSGGDVARSYYCEDLRR